MMRKGCELCSSQAKLYCESDQASLCWDCDEKVHGANFLVAKHMRTVLCNVCQSQTPWKAAGLKLGQTVSVCDGCVGSRSGDGGVRKLDAHEEKEEIREEVAQSRAVSDVGGNESYALDDEFDDEEDDSYSDDDYDDCDDEDDENQVVPWTSSPPLNAALTATASTSISGQGESSFVGGDGVRAGSPALRRMREDAFLHSKHIADNDAKEGAGVGGHWREIQTVYWCGENVVVIRPTRPRQFMSRTSICVHL
ncbi:hypothetical protein Ancab_025283 [Ancistrocladus abbreviatus]